MKNFGKGIGGALLSLAFVLGVSAVAGSSAQAQDRRDDGNYRRAQRDVDGDGDIDRNDRRQMRTHRQNNNQGDWRRNRNNGQYGNDGQRNQQYSPQRSHFYKDASSQAFRQGFVQGYNQGYQQYSRNGNYRNQRNGNVNGGWGNVLGGILRP